MTSDHASTSDHAVDIDRHVRVYITVFVALMVLTMVTVAVSQARAAGAHDVDLVDVSHVGAGARSKPQALCGGMEDPGVRLLHAHLR